MQMSFDNLARSPLLLHGTICTFFYFILFFQQAQSFLVNILKYIQLPSLKLVQTMKYNKKNGRVITAELVQSSRLPQLTSLSLGFVHFVFLAGGLPQSFSWPPPFVHSTVFSAEALPNEGASATARTAARPNARNIAFLFINPVQR
jgi:hypothetical protein